LLLLEILRIFIFCQFCIDFLPGLGLPDDEYESIERPSKCDEDHDDFDDHHGDGEAELCVYVFSDGFIVGYEEAHKEHESALESEDDFVG
jgi:hypothetical protein